MLSRAWTWMPWIMAWRADLGAGGALSLSAARSLLRSVSRSAGVVRSGCSSSLSAASSLARVSSALACSLRLAIRGAQAGSIQPPLAWLAAMQRRLPPLEQFRRELLEDSEFRALKLGSWLNTTDGKLIEEAVSMVIPPAYAPAYEPGHDSDRVWPDYERGRCPRW
jgi:hypothetical protein